MKIGLCIFVAFVCVLCDGASKSPKASFGVAGRTRLMHIPTELSLNIYELLDVSSLASMAKTHPYNRLVAEFIFKTQFNNRAFEIVGLRLNGNESQSINSYEFNGVLNAIELFGHLIKKLSIDCHFTKEHQSEQINRRLSKYAANSLVEIELKYCHDKNLKGLVGPFEKAEVVNLRDGHVGPQFSIDFSRVFPVVRRLDLRAMIYVSSASTEHHFDHLEELDIEVLLSSDSTKLKKRLRLNPQLRKVSLYGGTWKGLAMLSEVLPNLEHLDFRGFFGRSQFHGDELHFDHLKSFEVTMISDFPDNLNKIPIVFGELEEFMCDGPADKWFHIIMQNKKLKKIIGGEFSDGQFKQIAEELPNLEEFFTEWPANGVDAVDKIVHFIEKSRGLKRLAFYKSNSDVLQAVLKQLTGWDIVEEDHLPVFVRQL